jgi:hypothetical protein
MNLLQRGRTLDTAHAYGWAGLCARPPAGLTTGGGGTAGFPSRWGALCEEKVRFPRGLGR